LPRALILIVLGVAVLLAGCGGGDDDAATTGTTSVGALVTPTNTSQTNEKPTTAPTPGPGQVSVANEAFSVEAPDGVVVKGHAYTPEGPKRQALIIVAPVEQSVWAESAKAFTSEGIAVFTFDLPGFGETGGDRGEPRELAADVRLITRFVISREYPLVYLIGFGEMGGALVADDPTFQDLQAVQGFATYGYDGTSTERPHLDLEPDASWSGANILADPEIRLAVLKLLTNR
jgi:hypothetical protein